MLTVIDTPPPSYRLKTTVKTEPMSKSFFNTIRLNSDELEKAHARAASQEQLVAAIFRANPGRKISPSQIQTLIGAKYGRHCPLTSWRRAFSNLTADGVLTKCPTSDRIPGQYGLPEHTWQYNEAGDVKALETFMTDLQADRLEARPKVSPAPQPMHCAPAGFVQLQMFV
jgi:hypothetical protein